MELAPTINPSNEKMRPNDELNFFTIEECEEYFEKHYESYIHQYTDTDSEPKDKLSILRTCVELLNRLEDTPHDAFAGKVLIFLARVIPFFDVSGVNPKTEFSLRGLPRGVVETLQQIGAKNEKDKQLFNYIDRDMEEGETISDDESNEAAPHEDSERIFERFWKIQQFLNQPNLLYDKNSWFTFRTHVDTLVCKMENKPASTKVWKLENYYMSDPKALSLQINDINMRRCFLIQILIVIQYLDLPVESKPENYALDKIQMTWSSTIIKKIMQLLESMPNLEGGKKFLSVVKHILKSEMMWNQWKNEKCKEPKTVEDDDIVNMGGTYHKRRKISDELTSAKPYQMRVVGSPEMTKNWNMKPHEKFVAPKIDDYLNIPLDQQDETFKDPNQSFKALRLLRKSPHFFGSSSGQILSLDGYLKSAAERYANAQNLTPKLRNSEADNEVMQKETSN